MNIINVTEEKADIRIDKYLIEELNYSRSKIQKLIKMVTLKSMIKILK